MIGQMAEWVNGLVAAVSLTQRGNPGVSGALDVVTIIAVSALAILALQDLILTVVRRLADLIRSMSHIAIDARRDGVHIDLEAREASNDETPCVVAEDRADRGQAVGVSVGEGTGSPETDS